MDREDDFLQRAIKQVREAIDADNANQYEKAYQLYYQALELFMLAIKWQKNEQHKQLIRQKTAEYMDRAEKLKVQAQKLWAEAEKAKARADYLDEQKAKEVRDPTQPPYPIPQTPSPDLGDR